MLAMCLVVYQNLIDGHDGRGGTRNLEDTHSGLEPLGKPSSYFITLFIIRGPLLLLLIEGFQ